MSAEFRARFDSSTRSVGEARRAVIAHARRFGYGKMALDDIECAVGEALANAAEHGFRDGTTFDVSVRVEGSSLVIDVQDDGPGFPHASASEAMQPPAGGSPRGFGIFIMRSLMDEIAYTDRGRRITLKKRLPAAAAGDGCSDVDGPERSALG